MGMSLKKFISTFDWVSDKIHVPWLIDGYLNPYPSVWHGRILQNVRGTGLMA